MISTKRSQRYKSPSGALSGDAAEAVCSELLAVVRRLANQVAIGIPEHTSLESKARAVGQLTRALRDLHKMPFRPCTNPQSPPQPEPSLRVISEDEWNTVHCETPGH